MHKDDSYLDLAMQVRALISDPDRAVRMHGLLYVYETHDG